MAFWDRFKKKEEPVEEAVEPVPIGLPPTVAYKRTEKRILIVEDAILDNKLMEKLLKSQGFQTSSALEAADAMALYDPRPDLILLDMSLPATDALSSSWDGQRLLNWFWQRGGYHPPVIVITGNMNLEESALAPLGVKALYQKPVPPRELLVKIDEILAANSRSTAIES